MTNLIALPDGTELVGDYRIERVLGAGGFGITYLADEIALDRPVTIKEYFPSDFAARNKSHEAVARSRDCSKDYRWGLDRFIEEAQTLARFDHPNIVRVYRYFRANNTGYMVLQWEEGNSLKTWLKELKRAPRQKELDEIIAPLLDALDIIHKTDFLHRDIAPDNIIVRKSGAPVLIDFGSARGEIAAHSKTVSALVKPGYSPYEQYAETSRRQGPWTDIYALGATLYHAVTGKRPPDAPSRMVHDELIPAREAALSSYRAGFLYAIDRALSLEIKDRPQSVAIWRGQLLAPDPPRQGWLAKALDAKRVDSEAHCQETPEAAPASTAAAPHRTIPPPPDMPGPQGGLLDFLDRLGAGKQAKDEHPKEAATLAAAAKSKETAKPAKRDTKTPAQAKRPSPNKDRIKARAQSATDAAAMRAGGTVVLDPAEAPSPLKLEKQAANRNAQAGQKADGKPSEPLPADAAKPAAANKAADAFPKEPIRKAEIVPAPKRRAPKLFTRNTMPKPVKRRSTRRVRPLLAKLAIGACVATAAVMLQNRLPDLLEKTRNTPGAATNATGPVSPQIASVAAHQGGASLLRYSGDGTRLFSTGADGTLKVWSQASLTLKRTIPLQAGPATALAVNGDSALTGHADGQINLWDTASGAKRATYQRNEADVWSLTFAGDGKRFLTATHDWKVALWDAARETAPLHVFSGHENAVQALAYAPASSIVASGGADRTVKLWSLTTLDLIRTYRGARDFISSLALSPDGKLIAAASLDGTIRVWSTSSRSQRRRFLGHQGAVNQIAFAPDSSCLVSAGSDGTVRVWDMKRRRAIRAYTGHQGGVKAAQFSPDGKHIATAGADGTIRIWIAAIPHASDAR